MSIQLAFRGNPKTITPAEPYALRDYQESSVEHLFRYFEENDGNPILSLPTASGKSVIQAAFIKRTLDQWPGERFLLLTHVKELIEQNADKLQALGVDVGIYSAGLGRKELEQVTVAGIQSIYKNADKVEHVSIVMIDEAHTVSKASDTMYRKFLADLIKINPSLKVIGMSATPYRLDSGSLIKGDNRIFTDIAYQISIKELIGLGYLSPLISAPTETRANTDNVKKRGGEFIIGELQQFMIDNGLTDQALDEVERLCTDRKSWLVFCVGVDHAEIVRDKIAARGYPVAIVIGDTPKEERRRRIKAFKDGELRALVSVGVLTTGFDAPNADALICLRPTMSPGLWVQMVGRVTRIAFGKEDGLVLDFTANTAVHGPVDLIEADGDGNVKTAPARICPKCDGENHPRAKECCECRYQFVKDCPNCGAICSRDATECADCDYCFRVPKTADHNITAYSGGVLSGGEPEWSCVTEWRFTRHTKTGKPDSVRVWYGTGMLEYCEWICFEHGGYASQKADLWWCKHGGHYPIPETTGEALDRCNELRKPDEILLRKRGKYWEISESR